MVSRKKGPTELDGRPGAPPLLPFELPVLPSAPSSFLLLLVTSASLLVTSALLVVTNSY